MFKDEHVVPCESIHHHLFDQFFLSSTHYLKKKRLLWNYESGKILDWKSMKNSWKHLHPFQIVYFWPVLTVPSNSAISIYTPFKLSIFDLFGQCPATLQFLFTPLSNCLFLTCSDSVQQLCNFYLHPFQIVYFDLFWQCPATLQFLFTRPSNCLFLTCSDIVQQLCNFFPEENSWNQLKNYFFLSPMN